MYSGRSRFPGGSRRVTRGGLLYLGALREILVISVATGLVLFTLSNASSVFRWHPLSEDLHALNCNAHPVRGLDFDRDKQVLIVHSWPEEFEQIHLETGTVSKRRTPGNLVSAATSRTNSTRVMLSEWSDGRQMLHQVYIFHGDELVLSEALVFDINSSANARVSDDGTVVMVISHEGCVIGWDLATRELTRWEFQLDESAQTNSLSPDGNSLVISSDLGCSSIRDSRTGKKQITLPDFMGCSRTVGWSSDGRRLAVADQSGGLYVFEATSGNQIWQSKLDFMFARSIALSQRGNLLAVGGFDKQIHVWDLSQPTDPPATLTGEAGIVHNFAFMDSDTTLISGSHDGSIREWSLVKRELMRKLR